MQGKSCFVIAALLTTLFASLSFADEIGFIKVAEDNWNFVDSKTGKIFTPIGCNYYDAHTGWAPNPWSRFNPQNIERDFKKMHELGVNIVRLPVLTGAPWIGIRGNRHFGYNSDTLNKLHFVVRTAEKYNIRLILSAFTWEDYPRQIGDLYTDETALRYQEFGWRIIARRLADNPIVFSYSLMNEPRVRWENRSMRRKWNEWLEQKYKSVDALKAAWGNVETDEDFGHIDVPDNAHLAGSDRLYDYQLFREDVAYNWTSRLVKTIREVDSNHMVSLGNVQWSAPFDRDRVPSYYSSFDNQRVADLLDYISIHYYPFSPWHPESLNWAPSDELLTDWFYSAEAFIRYSYAGKPVVLEEFNWGLTPRGEQRGSEQANKLIARWTSTLIKKTADSASGWVIWSFQDTPSSRDISVAGGLVDADGDIKPLGEKFQQLAQCLRDKQLERSEPDVTMTLDRKSLLTSGEALEQFWAEYLDLRREGKIVDFKFEK